MARGGSARLTGGHLGVEGPGRKADGWILAAGQKKQLQELYQLGPQLGSGGFGTVFSGIRLSDGSPVSDRACQAWQEGQGCDKGREGQGLSSTPLSPWLAGGHQMRGPGECPAVGRAGA